MKQEQLDDLDLALGVAESMIEVDQARSARVSSTSQVMAVGYLRVVDKIKAQLDEISEFFVFRQNPVPPVEPLPEALDEGLRSHAETVDPDLG